MVGVSTWTLSSWFEPPNGSVKKPVEHNNQPWRDVTVTAKAKAMVVQSPKDDEADVTTTTTTTTLMTTTTNKMTKNNDDDDDEMTRTKTTW